MSNDLSCYLNTQLSILDLNGPQAIEFINQISSQTVKPETLEDVQLNSLCNNKGRIIALFYAIVAREDLCHLIVPKSLNERLVKLLQLYRLRTKVEITVSPKAPVMVTKIPQMPSLKDHPAFHLPRVIRQQTMAEDIEAISTIGRGVWLGELSDIVQVATKIQTKDVAQHWHQQTLLQGQPWLESDTSEKYLPQSLNLDAQPLSACSLTKGCYPGQEVIARMYYLGKRKRSLYLCHSPHELKLGEDLTIDPSGLEEVGSIVNVVESPSQTDRSYLGLAELNNTALGDSKALYHQGDHLVDVFKLALPVDAP